MRPPTPGLQGPADLLGRTGERLAKPAVLNDQLNDPVLGTPRFRSPTCSLRRRMPT
jgi:hypothetical protein